MSNNEKPENAESEQIASTKGSFIQKGVIKHVKKKRIRPASDMSKAVRYSPEYNVGLNDEQVKERMDNGYVNVTSKKKGKSYGSIICSNVFTFFNILTFIVAAALIWAHATFTQLFFLLIITANILIGIIQEIRSKLTIDKLSLITAPTAITVRNGEMTALPINVKYLHKNVNIL